VLGMEGKWADRDWGRSAELLVVYLLVHRLKLAACVAR